MTGPGRILSIVAAAVILVGVLLLWGTRDDPPDPPAAPTPSTSAPTSASTATPGSVPAADFCAAFARLADANVLYLSDPSAENQQALQVAADITRQLAANTLMSPPALEGVNAEVDGVLGTATALPPPAATAAFDDYLLKECKVTSR